MRKKSLIISENMSSELTYSNKENTTNYKETVKRVNDQRLPILKGSNVLMELILHRKIYICNVHVHVQ